jgi:cytochrome c-type biogenesis protein CcmE
MNKMHVKLAVAGFVFLGALSYLAFAGAKQASVYHLTVDQFLAGAQFRTQRVRLCGTVSEKDFQAKAATLAASFILKGTAAEIPVQYHGIIPDLFQANRDVVIEGQLNASGVFIADVMMTKCASKYESDSHGPMDKSAIKDSASIAGRAS